MGNRCANVWALLRFCIYQKVPKGMVFGTQATEGRKVGQAPDGEAPSLFFDILNRTTAIGACVDPCPPLRNEPAV